MNTHTYKFLSSAKAEIFKELNSLSCGKWRKISKSRCDLDLEAQCRTCPSSFHILPYAKV